jgi:hypothetical protein
MSVIFSHVSSERQYYACLFHDFSRMKIYSGNLLEVKTILFALSVWYIFIWLFYNVMLRNVKGVNQSVKICRKSMNQ